MAKGLDELSRVIGQQESTLKSMAQSFDRHCDDDDRRHTENQEVLKAIEKDLRTLTASVAPIAKAVAAMQPVVDGYQITRFKFIGALAVVSVLLAGVGWLATAFFGKAFGWILGIIFAARS